MSLPEVDNFVNLATRVYAFMRIQTDLSPRNNALNSLLTVLFQETLKRRCVQEVNAILNSPQLHAIAPGLRTLLGEAEYEMERYCPAAIVGDGRNPISGYSSFDNFLYRAGYQALVDSEIELFLHLTAGPEAKSSVPCANTLITALNGLRRTRLFRIAECKDVRL
ncbi:MAG: hypothetical protein EBY17_03050 [Acidobacteriia bacterium]|nr:hypothetical protein [Terriglobia bacterium]